MSLNSAPARRLNRALDGLWCLASAPQALALLLALLAAALAFAAGVSQMPRGLDAAAQERWLAATLPQFGRFGQFLRAVGAFDVLDGVFVYALLAALAFVLALRLAAQIRFALRLRRRTDIPLAPAGLPIVQADARAALTDAAQRVADACRAGFPVVRVVAQERHVQVYAERRRGGAWGPALTYLAALLLILGLLLDGLLGWGAPISVTLAPGASAAVGPSDPLALTLEAVTDEPASSTVVLARAGQAATVRARFAWPGRWRNIWLAQRATGPALVVSARDDSGRPLPLQSLAAGGEVDETLQMLFSETQNEQAFAIPTRNLTLRAIYYPALPDRDITEPVYQVEAYREDEAAPLVSALVEDEAEVPLAGATLSLAAERYVELAVAYLPGLALIAAGGLLLLAGATLSACYGPERIWADLIADGEQARIAVRQAQPFLPRGAAAQLLAAFRDEAPGRADAPDGRPEPAAAGSDGSSDDA
ncbi:MAG: ResB-like family protein [Chloroflexi bacterium ADurb.Bin325]|nr:MAG: ResB-like family protein [Chloroflexi bacterium ADurb.Bin325]